MALRTTALILGLLCGGAALAQAPAAPAPTPGVPRKARPTKKVPPKPTALPSPETPVAPAGEAPSEVDAPPEAPAWLFPDWAPDAFSWGAAPVLGFRLTADDLGVLTQMEGGLTGGVRGIPLVSGNPGATLAPHAGYALGYAVFTPESGDVVRGVYHRAWGGADLPLTVKFFKHTLGVSYGNLWGEVIDEGHDVTLSSDSAVLVLPFLSAHYTYTRSALFGENFSDKLTLVHDNWWHLRFFTSFLNAYLDLGPGYEIPYVFVQEAGKSRAHSRSSAYFLTRMGAEVLPRFLEADGQFRYTIESSEDPLLAQTLRRPSDDLNAAPPALGQPADSLLGSLFLGWKGAFLGMGLGYRYSVEVLHLSDDALRETRTTQGFGLHMSQRF